MLCKEIIQVIEQAYPKSCAMQWDNVGLLVGRQEKEVERIYVALDLTDEVLEDAVEKRADMIVTHHPLIFTGMKKITDEDFIGRRIVKMIQNDISYYAMHTNYDVMGMSDLAGECLELIDSHILDITCEENPVDHTPKGIGKIADLAKPVTLGEYCEYVKEKFGLSHVKVFGDLNADVRRVAISPGSGKSMIDAAILSGGDVLITGDIDHHSGIDAVAKGLSIIDAGHYGIEHIFIRDLAGYLRSNIHNIEIIETEEHHPFRIV